MPERKVYTDEFKQQLVDLFHSGKRKVDITREYNVSDSALSKWIKQSSTSGSFREKDNRSPEEEELISCRTIQAPKRQV